MAKKDGNLRIPLTSNKFLVGDGLQYWIVQEVKKKDGETYDKRLSGYHFDYENLMKSHVKKILGDSGIENLEEFYKEMKRLEKLIHKWCKELENKDGTI